MEAMKSVGPEGLMPSAAKAVKLFKMGMYGLKAVPFKSQGISRFCL
jgi:hypothetical protein